MSHGFALSHVWHCSGLCCHQIPEEPFNRNNGENVSEWCCSGFSTFRYTALSVKLSKAFSQTLQFSSVQFSLVQFSYADPLPGLLLWLRATDRIVWCIFIYVLFFFCSVHLYYLFPSLEEGGLATYRTAIVQNQHLAMLAKVCPTSEPGVLLLSPCTVLYLNPYLFGVY